MFFFPLANDLEFAFSDVSTNFWRLELPVGDFQELLSEVDSVGVCGQSVSAPLRVSDQSSHKQAHRDKPD